MERREFTNKFLDYSGENLLDSNNKLNKEFLKRLQMTIENLKEKLYKGLEHEDSSDFSIYTGISGIGLLHFHLHNVLGSNDKDNYLKMALDYIKRPLKHLQRRKVTFLCGDAGPLALGAVLYKKFGKSKESDECLERLQNMHSFVCQDSSLPDELLFGRAGYLFALLFVQHHLGDMVDSSIIVTVCQCILESGKSLAAEQKSKLPLMYMWHDKIYLGAAHGMAGIFYLLMQVSNSTIRSAVNELVKPWIDYMLTIRYPSGNCPSSLGSTTDKLVHWCHGAPGWIFTFVLAYKIFGDSKFLDGAIKCAEVIWKRGILQKGYGICHGTSGNAYAFISLFKLTGDQKYLHQAMKFAEWCFDYGKHGCRTADRPFSLFEGMAGTIYFLADMMDPLNAKFPAFEL